MNNAFSTIGFVCLSCEGCMHALTIFIDWRVNSQSIRVQWHLGYILITFKNDYKKHYFELIFTCSFIVGACLNLVSACHQTEAQPGTVDAFQHHTIHHINKYKRHIFKCISSQPWRTCWFYWGYDVFIHQIKPVFIHHLQARVQSQTCKLKSPQ